MKLVDKILKEAIERSLTPREAQEYLRTLVGNYIESYEGERISGKGILALRSDGVFEIKGGNSTLSMNLVFSPNNVEWIKQSGNSLHIKNKGTKYVKTIKNIDLAPLEEVTAQKMIQKRQPEFFYIKGQAQTIMSRGEYSLLYSNDAYYVVNEENEVVVYFQLKADNVDGIQLPKVEFITTNEKFKGTSLVAYEFIFSLHKGIWSDTVQSPGGQKIWGKLADRYNVFAYDPRTKLFYDVENVNGVCQSVDPKIKIYGSGGVRLCCFRIIPDNVKQKIAK